MPCDLDRLAFAGVAIGLAWLVISLSRDWLSSLVLSCIVLEFYLICVLVLGYFVQSSVVNDGICDCCDGQGVRS